MSDTISKKEIEMKEKSSRKGHDFWEKHVDSYKKSGLSQKAFCRQQHISYWSFNSWKRKLEKGKAKNKIIEIPQDKFKSLISVPEPFEIIISNNVKILIPDTFNPETLKQIIQAVEAGK